MIDDPLLTLHCHKCVKIVEVVTEGNNLVCLDCGHKFDERVAAKYLSPALPGDGAAMPAETRSLMP